MAHVSKMTLRDLPSIHEFVGLPLDLIKAKPNLLTSLLSPNNGYMQTVRDVYKHKKGPNDSQSHDPLTLIIDIDETIIYKFKWTDMFFIGEQIEFDEQKAIITEVHYMIETEENEDQYLAHITSLKHSKPQCGAYINGEVIKHVSVYQINVELENTVNINSFKHIKTMTMESIDRRISATVTDTEMDTPQPIDAIVINIKDDIEKLNKISRKQIFAQYKDEVLQIEDDYVAIRPDLDKFLFLCSKIFNNVVLFTSCADNNNIINGVHDYLCHKLKEKKLNKALWNQIVYNSFDGTDTKENIAQLGVDLSRVFILDASDVRFSGLEPNRIKVRRYVVNMNDSELMDRVWPILFECHMFNDVRYALLQKEKQQKTPLIKTEKESSTATMRFLVILQYSYFKSCKILDKSNDYNQYQENKAIYSTDDDADDEYQTSDESDDDFSTSSDYDDDDDESVSDEESEYEPKSVHDDHEQHFKYETQQNYGCISVFNGVYHDFIAKCVSR